jgi:putative membrane protein
MTSSLMPLADAHPLATLNASLNALAAVLLVTGYVLIRRRHERAHRNVMLAAFAVSVAFLTSYLAYHVWPIGAKATPFPGEGPMLLVYRVILITHIVLAAAVPFLAMRTIWLGYVDRRTKHRRLGRWTFYIWLYVSVTGVLIYWMLYQLYPQPSEKRIMATTTPAVLQDAHP